MNMIACAKMIGITPAAFTFKGIHCLAPSVKAVLCPPLAWALLTYCTGIFLTATDNNIAKTITNNQNKTSTKIMIEPNPPLLVC